MDIEKDDMSMSGQSTRRAVLRGLGWGLVASLLSSWTFTLLIFLKEFYLDAMLDPLKFPPPTLSELFADVGFILVILFFGFSFNLLFSCIPGMVCGAALGVLVHYVAPRVARPVSISILIGVVVGGTAGVSSSFLALGIFQMRGEGILLIMAYVVAALAGGLVGWRLGLTYQSSGQFTESGPS
jgi:hypothetical protein